jgi:hypothetical protein
MRDYLEALMELLRYSRKMRETLHAMQREIHGPACRCAQCSQMFTEPDDVLEADVVLDDALDAEVVGRSRGSSLEF